MKASDYIVEFLIQNKITDIFGSPARCAGAPSCGGGAR